MSIIGTTGAGDTLDRASELRQALIATGMSDASADFFVNENLQVLRRDLESDRSISQIISGLDDRGDLIVTLDDLEGGEDGVSSAQVAEGGDDKAIQDALKALVSQRGYSDEVAEQFVGGISNGDLRDALDRYGTPEDAAAALVQQGQNELAQLDRGYIAQQQQLDVPFEDIVTPTDIEEFALGIDADQRANDLEREYGYLATINGYETAAELAQGILDQAVALGDQELIQAIAGLDEFQTIQLSLDPNLLATFTSGPALTASIYRAPVERIHRSYVSPDGQVVEYNLNPVVYNRIAEGIAGYDPLSTGIVLDQVHNSMTQANGGVPSEFDLGERAPFVAVMLRNNGALDSYLSGLRLPEPEVRGFPETPFQFSTSQDRPLTEEEEKTQEIARIVDSFFDRGGDDDGESTVGVAFGQAVGERVDESIPTVNPVYELGRIDREIMSRPPSPTMAFSSAADLTTQQLDELTERYGRVELALIASEDRQLADRIYENGSPPSEQDATAARQIFDRLGGEELLEVGFASGQEGQDILTNLFQAGGTRGQAASQIEVTLPDPDSSRETFETLYRSLLIADPTEAELQHFVSAIEGQYIANANQARAEIVGSYNFWKDEGGEGVGSQAEANEILRRYSVDAQSSALQGLKATEAYQRLYQHKPSGIDPFEYASAYRNRITSMVGDIEGMDVLSAQRKGMEMGDEDVAVSRAALSEAGFNSSSMTERWARVAEFMAERL